jgi:serine/threonine-protein phosphatase 5
LISPAQAYYRRALSNLSILRPALAVTDLKTVLRLEPNNKNAREQLDTIIKLIRKVEFEKAIAVGATETGSQKALKMIQEGAVPLVEESSWKGSLPTYDEKANRYRPTKEWIEEMIERFKQGDKLPKRIVWEIILGCKEALDKEDSLVEVTLDKGVKCDIVGDTHGVSRQWRAGRLIAPPG